MNHYYLMAQLPSLDVVSETAALPITEEAFHEVCARFVDEKLWSQLSGLTLLPDREGGRKFKSGLLQTWDEGERMLRLALAKERAARQQKLFDTGNTIIPDLLLLTAHTATEITDPLEAERYLNQHRMRFLEELRPMDNFCDDMLFYYSLKLKLLLRMRVFDTARGRAAYRNTYDSILRGEDQEQKS